jgi:two-component system sensor histidine kinase/response regulator
MHTNHKANILLVDDRPENLLALDAVLDKLAQNVVKAHSGKEALRCVLDRDFAVIVLDVQMPEMDGFETAQLIRSRPRSQQTPIIFLTAFSKSDLFIFQGYSLGAVDYILKPFDPDILRAKVAVFVELFQKTEQVQQQAAQLEKLNKKLEGQLHEIERLNQELAAANKELENFNASVCHDLRNPLTSIKGFSKLLLLKSAGQLDETEKHFLEIIQMASERMENLIEDLMNLSLGTGQQMRRKTVNLSEIARTVLTRLQQEEPHRKVELTIAEEVRVEGDEMLLEIVMDNLLGNAWKYTRKKERAEIEFGVCHCEGKPTYFVRDNGAGFNMADATSVES